MSHVVHRALIIEDDRSWQQILSEILGDAGLTVDTASSLEAAIASIRALPHRLAIVDLSLGGNAYHNRDGVAVLDAVRNYDPGCVAIMLTGYATVELAVTVLGDHGAFTCVRKETFQRAQFTDLVRRALANAPGSTGESRAGGDLHPSDAAISQGEIPATCAPCERWALVVEDDAGWREILSELLADAGYRARVCSSYGQALGYLRREEYDVAVVDLSLQSPALSGDHQRNGNLGTRRMDGYPLLDKARARGIPAIVISGVASTADIERAYAEYGIFACLAKQTFHRQAFLQTVAEALAADVTSSKLHALSPREREVLELVAHGLTNKEIAASLVITTNTVKRHLKSVFKKLQVHTRSAAAAAAAAAGVPRERSSAALLAPDQTS